MPVSDEVLIAPLRETMDALRESGATYAQMVQARRDRPSQGMAFRLYYGGYPVQDGAIILGALTPQNRDQIRAALEITDDPTDNDDFNAIGPDADAITSRLEAQIRTTLMSGTMAEWMERLDAVGAPASPINWPEDIADDPQVQAMGLMREVEHSLTGPERLVGPLVEMSATPTGSDRAAPPLDADTDALLLEYGFTDDEVDQLRDSGAIGNNHSS